MVNGPMVTKMVTNQSFGNPAGYSRPERSVESRCSIGLHRVGDVGLKVHRRGDRRVPEALLRDLGMDPIGQELGRVAMAKVVKPNTRQISYLACQAGDLPRHAPRLLGFAVLSATDQRLPRLSNSKP